MVLIQLTGLSGAGKTTISFRAKAELERRGYKVEVIDGDEYRSVLCRDLGFSKEDRFENLRRLGFVARTLARNGVIVFLAAVNPYEEIREELRRSAENVRTVWVDCDLETLKRRDTKGLYERALLPDDHPEKLRNLTGVNDPFEVPANADLTIRTDREPAESSASKLVSFVLGSLSGGPGKRPRAMFVGRWQPFHNGHRWLIDQKLNRGVPVLIAVRDIEPDASNPFTTAQTVEILTTQYAGRDVEIVVIPDIESVNFGRAVGYEINEFTPPEHIGGISATAIRDEIARGSNAWRAVVDERIQHLVERFLSAPE